MRQYKLADLERRAKSSLEMAERFGRVKRVRRRPRSAVESALMGEIIARRVREAYQSGEIMRDGERLIIRIK